MIDINIENFKDFKGLKKKLFQIFKAITGNIETIESSIEVIESTEIVDLKSRLDDIESNFIDRRVAFPLGTDNTHCFYAVGNDVTQNVTDNNVLLVDFLDELTLSPYVTTDAQNQRFFVQTSGSYNIVGQVMLNGINDDFQHVESRLLINGSTIKSGRTYIDDVDQAQERFVTQVVHSAYLTAGTEINLQVYQNNSTNVSRSVNISNTLSNINIAFLGNFSS